MKRALPWLIGMSAALSVSMANAQPSDRLTLMHDRAVELARAGKHDEALTMLYELREQYPDDLSVLDDLIVVLGWASRDEQAVYEALPFGVEHLPKYVGMTVAKSARNLKMFDTAGDWYEYLMVNNPDDVQARIGLALTFADRGSVDIAKLVLDAADPNLVDVQFAYAYIHERAGELVEALNAYNRILELSPEHPGALRGKALILRSLLMPDQALQMAEKYPGVFNEQEIARLKVDQIAVQVRLAVNTPYPVSERGVELDQALSSLESYLRQSDDASVTRTLSFDRIVGLAEGKDFQAAVSSYESLGVAVEDTPVYVLASTGKSYLELRQPRQALRLLESASARAPENVDLRFALIYTYLDTQQYHKAFQLADKLTAELPMVYRESPSSPVIKGNPARMRAEVIAGLADAYGDQFAKSQDRLEKLLAVAPNNSQVREELANLYLWRGWVDQSLFQYRQVLAVDDDYLSARTGYAYAQLAARQYPDVESAVAQLTHDYPQETSVEKLAEQWRLHNQNELYFSADYGDSSGDTFGTEQYRADTTWYSRPLAYRLRVTANLHRAEAAFVDGKAERMRLATGIDYRAERWTATTLLSGDLDGVGDPGLLASVDWRLGDRWRLNAMVDVNSNDTQLRADRLGIDSDIASLGTSFVPNEQMSFNFGYRHREMTDGNQGDSLSFNGSRRIMNRPRWKLDLTGEYSTSENALQNVPYYSPAGDATTFVGARLQWRTFRLYDRSVEQLVHARVGSYDQDGFGRGDIWHLQYTLSIAVNDALQFEIGAQRAHMVYDGTPEDQTQFLFGAHGRF